MPPSSSPPTKVIPAHLNFLAIYNPELGRREETERDQIVFYYSPEKEKRQQRHGEDAPSEKELREAFDEEMRQVGLAQGIVNFAKSFSDGEDVDSVETEKHRIVVTELESGWWVLASIALTVLPRQPTGATAIDPQGVGSVEYSAREVSPPGLLIQQLIRAHKIFLLHHSPTLTDHFVRLPRERFTNLLGTFWAPFSRNWDVLLHGNPAVEVYEGIKLAAGGELGVGVGEEDWGSGEREVLEDLIRHTDGLVDLAVARFGDAPGSNAQKLAATSSIRHVDEVSSGRGWLGCLEHAGPSDGMLFSGSGALARHSLHALSAWMEWIYTYGEDGYGIRDNPTSVRARRKRPPRPPSPEELPPMPEPEPEPEPQPMADTTSEHFPSIPPPIITAAEEALENATHSAETHVGKDLEKATAPGAGDGWTKYLTLGYGSSWFAGKGSSPSAKSTSPVREPNYSRTVAQTSTASSKSSNRSALLPKDAHSTPPPTAPKVSSARFLIGLRDDLHDDPGQSAVQSSSEGSPSSDEGSRISVRAVHVDINQGIGTKDDTSTISGDEHGSIAEDMMPDKLSKWKRLRLVVYINQPFIFALLFEPSTSALTLPSFYRNLHHHLLPLQKPLLNSTSPTNVALRLQSTFPSTTQASTPVDGSTSPPSPLLTNPIYNLIYSPTALTIHSSLPNIPLPGTLAAEGIPTPPTSSTPFATPPWTRIEALNVHSQILASWASTRRRPGEREQSAKTGRGWWVVWMRMEVTEDPVIGGENVDEAEEHDTRGKSGKSQTIVSYETQRQGNYREAILIRRATGAGGLQGAAGRGANAASSGTFAAGLGAGTISRWTGGLLGGSTAGAAGGSSNAGNNGAGGEYNASSATHGLGVDARKYVESLLSLNR